jgi:hypothetical protein
VEAGFYNLTICSFYVCIFSLLFLRLLFFGFKVKIEQDVMM